MTPKALTVAGSDSGGGAGIQADIKTFSALGVFGMSAITACTSQNTVGVTYVEQLSPESVTTQIDAVMDDIGADAVKTGMLYSKEIAYAVADRMKYWKVSNLVVDPVMVASTGALLMKKEDTDAFVQHIFPLARIITPNIPEAEYLTGVKINTHADKIHVCKILATTGASNVLLKGGHEPRPANGQATDLWYDGANFTEISSPWVDTKNIHGTGCTFSAAIAAFLAKNDSLEASIQKAKDYIFNAINAGRTLSIGHGAGPVNHFWKGSYG